MEKLEIVIAVLFIIAIVASIVWWLPFKYHECKRVGHSTVYCWMTLGSK